MSTDGIHDFIRHSDLQVELRLALEDPEQTCRKLTALALDNQSTDNLSCQIIRVDTLPDQKADDVYKKLTELPFPPDLEKGMILDGYRIIELIHASSRSQLYVVEDIETENRYVMKTPSVTYEDDPAYIERFVMESWIGSRIHSPHIVNVITVNRPQKFLYYLTEYIDGMTLKRWIKENPKASVQDVIYLARQIIKGVQAFHRKETLHQDLKPANILITRDGVVKIIDFGSCHVAGIAEIATPVTRDLVLGTASYSSPEAVLQGSVRVQSDIFSLGVIFYEMFTGRLPFGGKLESCRTPRAFQSLRYEPAHRVNPLVPVWIDGALRKALAFDQGLRYPEVYEFLHELTHPNPRYMKEVNLPLMERNPLRFWRTLTLVLALSQLVTGILLLEKLI